MLDRLERIFYVVARNGVHDVLREFVRACRGDDDHGRRILFVLGNVVARRVHRAGGVRIHRVLVLFKELVDGLDRLVLAAEVRPQEFLHLLLFLVVQLVHALCGELVHAHLHAHGVPARKLEQEPLEVGGDEDIHGGRHRLVKFAALVVHARADEVGQHVVLVRRADELTDGQPHALCIIRRKDVAEVARRHGEVDLRAHIDLPRRNEVEIRRKIVRDLRGEPAKVDGVRRREDHALFEQLLFARVARKDLFDGCLAFVEVAAHGDDAHVIPLLRRHLQLLHFGNAVVGVKHHDLDALGVLEPFQRRLARIAAGSNEDEHRLFDAAEVAPLAEKIGQKGERHILEGARRAVEQLEHVQPRVDLDQRRGVVPFEAGICRLACFGQLRRVVFVKIL